ncbi:MAG: hypothetical protein ACF8SC_02575 [Phycisphaerales bacterium JB037]
MTSRTQQPGAWLLLIVFSFGTLVPGSAGRLLMCFGCDEVGLSLASTAIASLDAEMCCIAETASGDDRPRAVDIAQGEELCDCVRVVLDAESVDTAPAPTQGEGPSLVADRSLRVSAPVSDRGGPTVRGPPAGSGLPADRSLLTQHTLLII